MNYTFEKRSIKKTELIQSGQRIIEVEMGIFRDGELIDIRKFTFPLDTTAEFIKNEIEKFKSLYLSEQEKKEKNAETDKVEAQADATIEELENIEI